MTKGDKILILIIILISGIVMLFNYINLKGSDDLTLFIEIDGKAFKEIELKEDTQEILDIKTEFGENKIEIDGRSVKVIEADCPDQLDVKQGAINKPGQMIVCLPNRLVLELKSDSNASEIDKMVR